MRNKPEVKKIIINFDKDGVIVDYFKGVMKEFKRLTPFLETVPYEQITSFGIVDHYPASVRQDIWNASAVPGFYENLEAMPGAIEVLKDIENNCQEFLEPFIVTSPGLHNHNNGCWSGKATWVHNNLGDWWERRLIITKDKTMVRGHLLVDDKPGITGALEPTWAQLVFPHPWNEEFRKQLGVQSFSWEQWPQLKADLKAKWEALNEVQTEPKVVVRSRAHDQLARDPLVTMSTPVASPVKEGSIFAEVFKQDATSPGGIIIPT